MCIIGLIHNNALDEQLQCVEKEAADMLAALQSEVRNQKEVAAVNTTTWKKRMSSRNEEWATNRESISLARIERESPVFVRCCSCSVETNNHVICCKTCKQELCPDCDERLHKQSPFHQRTLSVKATMTSRKLLPTEFADNFGAVKMIGKARFTLRLEQSFCG